MDERLRILLLVFGGLVGACVGSFLNVCIYRIPRHGLSVSKPRRSFCPACGQEIKWYDNIPILSWILLRGQCRSCRAPISVRYIAVEALTALVFVLIAERHLFSGELALVTSVVVAALSAALIVAAFIDLELRIIPDQITLGGMMAAPFIALFMPDLYRRPSNKGIQDGLEHLKTWLEGLGLGPGGILAVAGAVLAAAWLFYAGLLGYALYWRTLHRGEPKPLRDGLLGGILTGAVGGMTVLSVLMPESLVWDSVRGFWCAMAGMLVGSTLVFLVGAIGSKVFRKPAMGFGDVKLMGLLGAFAGWLGVVEGFFLACLMGSLVGIVLLVRYRSRYLPFGPFLAAGCLFTILWPGAFKRLLEWYLSLFR